MITNRNLRQTLEAELTIVAERAIGGGAPDYPLLLVLFSIDRHLTRIARAVEKLAASPSLDADPAARASTPGTITPGILDNMNGVIAGLSAIALGSPPE